MLSRPKWRMKCLTDSAIELTWPGVPVTACASMRPCASKMPAERSPASRTIDEKAVRSRVCACSSTTASRRFHMICRSMSFGTLHMLGSSVCLRARRQDQSLASIDGDVEARRHVGRRAFLNDQRGPVNVHARQQRATLENLHDLAPAKAHIEYGTRADRRRRRPPRNGREACRQFALGGGEHHPAHDLYLGVGNMPRKQTAILGLKLLAKGRNVAGRQLPIGQADHDFVALPGVAHKGGAPQQDGAFARSGSAMRARIAHEAVDDGVGLSRRELRKQHVARTHKFVGSRCRKEAERRADTCIRRHDDTADAELFRDATGMQGGGATESYQRALADGNTTLDRMHARRICHVLIDDFADADRSLFAGLAAEFVANATRQRDLSRADVDGDLAAGESVRIDLADRQIGVGDRRLAAAPPVAGWARFRTGAVWPNQDPL